MAVHAGSWFGLPDFGITEAVGGFLGANRTPQGGSNIRGSIGQVASAPAQLQAQQNLAAAQGGLNNRQTAGGTGQVLGASTTGGVSAPQTLNMLTEQTPSAPSGPSAEDLYRQQQEGYINSGWDTYENQLNSMLNTSLPGQQAAQNTVAENTYNQGISDLGTQKTSSESAVKADQAKNLKDLAANVRNLFQSGNIMLGSRGAGDSSAANMYSYAVGKMGTKARGDIMGQVSDRMNQIRDIYTSESNRMKNELESQKASIAQWFYSAQDQLRQSLAQAGMGRSNDLQALSTNLYNQALSSLQTMQQQVAQRQSTLEAWAASNSQNVQQLVSNLQSIGSSLPSFTGIQGGTPTVTSEGNYNVPLGYNTSTTEKRDIYGNIIK